MCVTTYLSIYLQSTISHMWDRDISPIFRENKQLKRTSHRYRPQSWWSSRKNQTKIPIFCKKEIFLRLHGNHYLRLMGIVFPNSSRTFPLAHLAGGMKFAESLGETIPIRLRQWLSVKSQKVFLPVEDGNFVAQVIQELHRDCDHSM